ncbi:MAG: AAA family ATPase [Oscillospiraceae bacterium]|nr:AAA family ATPase [Oscillospiraceae bacterium]
MSGAIMITQLFFTLIIGMYFLTKLKVEKSDLRTIEEHSAKESEHLKNMRRICLCEPMTEAARPENMDEIIGQQDGIRALRAALCGPDPQHILIYGPPGVGKTAAARLALEYAKDSEGTPFGKNAKFVEVDATIMRYDERSIADPLIGSVHDPIYQGAGAYGTAGIPQPKEGAVSKAHGGVLFIDEIGELPACQMNKLLKVLEDRKVMFESAYYSQENKNIPEYIHDIFKNGIPADFRLIGATTRKSDEIPEAIRSRCVEIWFNELSRDDIEKIILKTAKRFCILMDDGAVNIMSQYAKSGRDAVKLLQMAKNIVFLDGRKRISTDDAAWTLNACRYTNGMYFDGDEKIIDISVIKPKEKNS